MPPKKNLRNIQMYVPTGHSGFVSTYHGHLSARLPWSRPLTSTGRHPHKLPLSSALRRFASFLGLLCRRKLGLPMPNAREGGA